jgi:DNA-binding IclR family transcriptional regulator
VVATFQHLKVKPASSHAVASAFKVLDALRILCSSDQPVLLAALAAELEVSAPTAYRAVQTLLEAGFAARAPGRNGYVPTLEVVRLGGLITSREPLLDVVRAAFEPVRRKFSEPITVGVRDDDHILFVQKLSGPRDPRFYCDTGLRLPLHVGAAARCILAHLSAPDFETYLKRELTHRTPSTHAVASCLRKDREDILELGYTLSVDEVDVGISAVGVPIVNHKNQVLAGAAIANVTARWNEADIRERAETMTAAARFCLEQAGDLPSAGNGYTPGGNYGKY